MCSETCYQGNMGITTVCRQQEADQLGHLNEKPLIGPALDVQETLQYGRHCIEIKINSLQIENTASWVVISRGLWTHM